MSFHIKYIFIMYLIIGNKSYINCACMQKEEEHQLRSFSFKKELQV